MVQIFPNRCDQCGKVYTKKIQEEFASGVGFITCTGRSCRAVREFPSSPIAVLLQPGIEETHGNTGLVIVASDRDSNRWILPSGCICVNESAEETLGRIAKETLGITLNPQNLHDFCTKSNPKEQEHLSFYINTTRVHLSQLLTRMFLNTPKKIRIIQTTEGIFFESPLHSYAAEKFLLEIWGRRPLF